MNVPIIDLFAGPGGLGEGFSSFKSNGNHPFKIAVSVEKDSFAHQTLSLRAFVRQFSKIPEEYYKYLRGEIEREDLFSLYPSQAKEAYQEALCIELGNEESCTHESLVSKISSRLDGKGTPILIGGPPCQAYSLMGRSVMNKNESFSSDPRHTLYKEYLKMLAEFSPSVFIMENVKGILSSKYEGEYIFDRILKDLSTPSKILKPAKVKFSKKESYTVYSLVVDKEPSDLKRNEYVIKSEEYGIPQARHRVVLIGVRDDLGKKPGVLKTSDDFVKISDVIDDLPKLRAGISRDKDKTVEAWAGAISSLGYHKTPNKSLSQGGNFVKGFFRPAVYSDWYMDSRVCGAINHETRNHITSDIQRYHFMSYMAHRLGKSPKLNDLPESLLPNHKNVSEAISSNSLFNDRFKVQVANKPATTITSHISKDGHYFIHYDYKQSRSLTVREAARVQTFPDNYKFEGPRTSQYHQVGNAVPPLLARQIAAVVYELLGN